MPKPVPAEGATPSGQAGCAQLRAAGPRRTFRQAALDYLNEDELVKATSVPGDEIAPEVKAKADNLLLQASILLKAWRDIPVDEVCPVHYRTFVQLGKQEGICPTLLEATQELLDRILEAERQARH